MEWSWLSQPVTNPPTVRIKIQMAKYRLHRGRRYLHVSVGEVRLFLEQQCEWEVADVSRPNGDTKLLTREAHQ